MNDLRPIEIRVASHHLRNVTEPAKMFPSVLSSVNAKDQQQIFRGVYLHNPTGNRKGIDVFPENFRVHLQRVFLDCNSPVQFEVNANIVANKKEILLFVDQTEGVAARFGRHSVTTLDK